MGPMGWAIAASIPVIPLRLPAAPEKEKQADEDDEMKD